MQPRTPSKYLSACALLLMAAASPLQADNFTMAITQAGGAYWNQPIWQPGGVVPTAGNTYEMLDNGTVFGFNRNNTRIRNQAVAGTHTFPGDSLTMNANTELRAKTAGAILNFPGVNGQPGLILNGGILNAGDNAVFTITGSIEVRTTSYIVPADGGAGGVQTTRGFNIAGKLSGSGSMVIYQASTAVAQTISGIENTFTGDWLVKAGWLRGAGANSLGSGNITIDPNADIAMDASVTPANGPAHLEVMYDIVSPGKLTLINGGLFRLHQACTFKEVEIEGEMLTEGLHTIEELVERFPNSFGVGSTGSITVKVPGSPEAPLNLKAINRDTEIRLDWTASGGATSYDVKRGTVAGGPYTKIGTVVAPTYLDTGLANGTIYYYVVSAANTFGGSANSTELPARPSPPVTGVTTVGALDGITVNWTAFPDVVTYTVVRAPVAGGAYTALASDVTGTTYLDATALPGTRYFYEVVGRLNNGFDTAFSAETPGLTPPSKPITSASLYSTIATGLGGIRVKIRSTDPVVPQFQIEKSTDGTTFTPLTTLTTGNRYVDTAVSLDGTYWYRARSVNPSGISEFSDAAQVTYPSATTMIVGVNFANAVNGDPMNNLAATPAGYQQDVGEFFGEHNGFNYGWDQDITAYGRWRRNANSEDLRFDTFEHFQKAGRATWEIEIPNGSYVMHLATGDPTATDSTFQYDVEGVLSSTIKPITGDWWEEFTVSATVADGRLTVTAGPAAQNHKINFIEIYPGPSNDPKLTITQEGNNIHVTWTGEGTLQFKTDLNAPNWTDAGTSALTEAIPTTGGAKFFRVTRPANP